MTPDMIASEIKQKWEGVRTELVRRKRLDPNVYEEVVSTLAGKSPGTDSNANGGLSHEKHHKKENQAG
jgi:hypothetical protein